jgi:3-hydroxyisobutyrate dehydrogenase
MLPDPAAVEVAAHGGEGILTALREGALWLEMTSSSPPTTRAVAEQAAVRGARVLDAPVSGGVRGAEEGTLTIMVGGPRALLAEARPLLEVLGTIVHAGDRPGDGDLAKTVNNMLSATNLAAAAEALALGMRGGLDPGRLLDCVNSSTGVSDATRTKIPRYVLTGRFDSGFTIGQYVKDLSIALDVAAGCHVPAAVSSAARAIWTGYVARGQGDADHTELVALMLREAGVTEGAGEARPSE